MLPPPPPPPPPPPRRRRPEMPSSPTQSQEMSELHLKIHKRALTCMFCLHPLYDAVLRPCSFMCDGGHIYCHRCTQRHKKKCSSLCIFLEKITAQMKVKCNLCDSGYMPYRKFVGHLCDPPVHPELVDRQLYSDFELGDCTLDPNLLVCSECNHLLQLPIFMHVYDKSLVCGACYGNDIGIYIHHKELEYIVQRISVKCMACEEYLPFCALALHQVDDCPFKHKLQKIAPSSSARKNLCGKNKQKASYELGKMDKHIVQGDVVGNDDDSSADNIPESGMRVAENSKTFACNKKVKIASPHGQKTGAPTAAQDVASTSRCPPITAPSKPAPYKPCRPGTRLFQAANNRNRGNLTGPNWTKCKKASKPQKPRK
ncbi:hypothetical protein BS78_K009000 [Paspalum vaginatum]|uniref:Uncharacterized protein n=1 Tax=Paspalum vaginatum TaxID=158149 RepID=A0A9W7XCQ3_9POAL|nr:hypothetical protein BS78_K009000 [Paspalum vaginatum]